MIARREIIQIETLQNAAKETQSRNFILLYFSKNSFSPGEDRANPIGRKDRG